MQFRSLFRHKMKILFPAAGWFFMQLFASSFAEAEDSKIKVLTAADFSTAIAKNNHFVMFFAPWCTYCQRLEPTWEELAEMLNEPVDSRVNIAKVDCTTDTSLCSEHDVTGYPTLKFFKQGSNAGAKFRGTRDLPSLSTFINEQMNDDPNEDSSSESGSAPENNSGLFELTDDNFHKHIATGSHFVKFYAPWCGHCQKLAPTWNSLAKSFESDPKVRISKIDCTIHDSVCINLEIRSYPTLLWFEDGRKVEKYSGHRNLEDFQAYVQKMLDSKSKSSQKSKQVEEDVPDKASPVLALSTETFESGIEKGITFVKFFAPWCGHCKRLAPTWDELAKKFSENSKIKIAKVDCTLSSSKTLCNTQEVDGFPSLFLYIDGKKVSEYNGSRDLEDLYNFVIKHEIQHDEL
ncbi:unnamed protein product [Bemisia tabaci]|uniref:Thioredoxin domain-containing protein n=1 Tax=Bemisia tabaci TaxID=7038 RepID=A0A9P0AIV2_BEMTA|nr:PREDICTED: thioredoxin domain-containing protein 5-like [Bemisia tabaci]XP_018898688.1 PREDICTED: thioredoxin domain-containing protein 5-like [Bemisia tabaci]CAH0392699.1 unnamed protein product [Bemisia tabaci]